MVKSGKPATVDFGIESELPDSEEIDIKNSKLIFVSTNEIRCEKDFRTISDIMESANFKGKVRMFQKYKICNCTKHDQKISLD